MYKRYVILNEKQEVLEAFVDWTKKEIPQDAILVEETNDRHWHIDITNKKYIDGEFIDDVDRIERNKKISQLKLELQLIQDWYNATDYIPKKIVRGNWTTDDQRWVDYCNEYKLKHDEFELKSNELKNLLK
jgi:hypothetical protein